MLLMGIKRQAKDGHQYERRRTRGGRYYTVQRGYSAKDKGRLTYLIVLLGLCLAPITAGLSLLGMVVFLIMLACE